MRPPEPPFLDALELLDATDGPLPAWSSGAGSSRECFECGQQRELAPRAIKLPRQIYPPKVRLVMPPDR